MSYHQINCATIGCCSSGVASSVFRMPKGDVTLDDIGKFLMTERVGENVQASVYNDTPEEAGQAGRWILQFNKFTERENGSVTARFNGQPTPGEFITLQDNVLIRDFVTLTFVAGAPGAGEVQIGATVADTAKNVRDALIAWVASVKSQSIMEVTGTGPIVQVFIRNGYYETFKDNSVLIFTLTSDSAQIQSEIAQRPEQSITFVAPTGQTETFYSADWNHAGATHGLYPDTLDEEAENLYDFLLAELDPADFTVGLSGDTVQIDQTAPPELDEMIDVYTNSGGILFFNPITQEEHVQASTSNFFTGLLQGVEGDEAIIVAPRYLKVTLDDFTQVRMNNIASLILVPTEGGTKVRNIESGADIPGFIGIALYNADPGEEVWVKADYSTLDYLILAANIP